VEVQSLLVDATAACDAAFSVQTTDDLITAPEERLQALSARIRAVASGAVHQGAATALVTTQLEFGTVVKVQVVQQAFPPAPEDEDYIDDLFKRVEGCQRCLSKGEHGRDPA
jgi:hypothetical protein